MKGKTTAAIVLVLSGLTGCNTDAAWDLPRSARSLTTRIDQPRGVDLPDIAIADAREVDLVELVLTHRALYHQSLTALRDYYRERGNATKRRWSEHELADVNRIRPFRYLYSGEIPSDALVPRDAVPAADALYDQAKSLLAEGGHALPIVYRGAKMREALDTFRKLIETYPTSDKIDDAAFYCGEIHKEYFKGEELLAVRWYERAYTWNPQTPHPARFQAAAVYDLRLHDRDKALELYHDVIANETFNRSNTNFAMRRIQQLSELSEPKTLPSPPAAAITGRTPDGE